MTSPDAPLASLAEVSAAAAARAHVGAPAPGEAAVRPGEAGLPALAEARAYAPGPKWFRFPAVTWTMIRAEYLAGATAKQLALKWGVSPTSVYRHACQEGFTKARRGEAINLEAVTRFAAQAAEVEARAKVAADGELQARAAREAEAEPVETAETLVRRAGAQALAGRTDEAAALLRLAEGLMRAAYTVPGSGEPGWRAGGEGAPPDEVAGLEARKSHLAARYDRMRPQPVAIPPGCEPPCR